MKKATKPPGTSSASAATANGRAITVAHRAGASIVSAGVASTGHHQTARLHTWSAGTDEDFQTHRTLISNWVVHHGSHPGCSGHDPYRDRRLPCTPDSVQDVRRALAIGSDTSNRLSDKMQSNGN